MDMRTRIFWWNCRWDSGNCYFNEFLVSLLNNRLLQMLEYQTNWNIFNTIGLTKIVQIMYATYQGLSMRRLSEMLVRRNVNKASGVNLYPNFTFSSAPSFSPREITWLEPAIQSSQSIWSAVSFQVLFVKESIFCKQLCSLTGPKIIWAPWTWWSKCMWYC